MNYKITVCHVFSFYVFSIFKKIILTFSHQAEYVANEADLTHQWHGHLSNSPELGHRLVL